MSDFNKNFLRPLMRHQKIRITRSRAFPGKAGGVGGPLVFLLVAIAVLAVFYFASLSKGSREEFAQAQETRVDPAEAERLLAEAQSAESQFNAIHEFKKEQITDEDVDIYARAVELYGKHLAAAGTASAYNPRFEQMRRRLHNLRADALRKRSTALETQAEEFAAQKKYAEAEKLFSDASRLEFRITQEFPLATKKNHARANFLENRAKTMHAVPLTMRAQRLEREGEAALDAGNWPRANVALNEALSIEKELWANYRNVIVSNSSRILRLQDLIATVNSAPDYERREIAAANAREAEKKNEWKKAAEFWGQALAHHKTIAQNFPRSLYAAGPADEELARNFANANAHPEFILLQQECARMRDDIRSRRADRVPLLAKQALRRAENIRRQWPDSTLVSEEFLQELRYMDLKAPDIPGVQNSFLKLLLPVPGADAKTKMTKTEITQALYTFVMPFNPSARKELANPVESVDYNDAQEFCRRLSLLIGCPVRLPTQTEFAAAAGTPGPDELSEQAWLIENSSGVVQPVGKRRGNAAGFFDLYGNVSEWVSADPQNAGGKKDYEEFVAGGDCQTPTYSFPEEFFRKTPRSEKSRTRGFRVVAEIDDDAVPAAGTTR